MPRILYNQGGFEYNDNVSLCDVIKVHGPPEESQEEEEVSLSPPDKETSADSSTRKASKIMIASSKVEGNSNSNMVKNKWGFKSNTAKNFNKYRRGKSDFKSRDGIKYLQTKLNFGPKVKPPDDIIYSDLDLSNSVHKEQLSVTAITKQDVPEEGF